MQRPRLSAWLATGTLHPEATGTWWVTEDGSEWRLAMPGERPSAVVEVSAPKAGPAGDHPPLGLPGRVRLEISPTVVVAPQKARGYVIGCLAFLDDLLALGLADQYLLTG
jgi:hypothetical protein